MDILKKSRKLALVFTFVFSLVAATVVTVQSAHATACCNPCLPCSTPAGGEEGGGLPCHIVPFGHGCWNGFCEDC